MQSIIKRAPLERTITKQSRKDKLPPTVTIDLSIDAVLSTKEQRGRARVATKDSDSGYPCHPTLIVDCARPILLGAFFFRLEGRRSIMSGQIVESVCEWRRCVGDG
ncbi:hypothetical protein BLNAU_8422 [Blattamonas nauphoetae]|uniref:Uncharacterized protein n=1 Tax=Blattamonas nauphoetae TaxID=2049346 RepID=A0ABQ9XYL3_9EUKA|nr:hypothetical protein BLNAU_8422 [Blattamonas nauphoetae]